MALFDTAQKREKQANQDLAAKLALERELIINLRKYFTDMTDEFEKLYADTGVILDTTQFNEQLKTILFEHYNKTSNKFKDDIFKHDDIHDDIKNDEEAQARIDLAIEHFTIFNVGQSVNAISKTNQSQASRSIQEALLASAAGVTLTRQQIARAAKVDFARVAFARTNTIAATETQKPAEGTKDIEATQVNSSKQQETPMLKTWNAVLDEKTRGSHAEADGQTVEVNGVYIVQGERLRFPGDTSLGASPSNIINCRCASVPHSATQVIR